MRVRSTQMIVRNACVSFREYVAAASNTTSQEHNCGAIIVQFFNDRQLRRVNKESPLHYHPRLMVIEIL